MVPQPNNPNFDPSIISRPKNSNRSTSFFAQPGTLAGKFKTNFNHTCYGESGTRAQEKQPNKYLAFVVIPFSLI